MMKKILVLLGLLIVIVVCLWMFFLSGVRQAPDNPAGKTIYYTMIASSGSLDANKRYDYEVIAYNERGKEKKLKFSASKELKEGAYIRLYYTVIRGVTSWQEVSFQELPDAVQEKY